MILDICLQSSVSIWHMIAPRLQRNFDSCYSSLIESVLDCLTSAFRCPKN